jgi:tetratricopeptide (TPR) repeat protein
MDEALKIQAQIRSQSEEQAEALHGLSRWHTSLHSREDNDLTFDNKKLELEPKSNKLLQDVSSAQQYYGYYTIQEEEVNNDKHRSEVENSYNSGFPDETQQRTRGNTLYEQGKFQDAIQAYTQCLTITPDSTLAYSNRGASFMSI